MRFSRPRSNKAVVLAKNQCDGAAAGDSQVAGGYRGSENVLHNSEGVQGGCRVSDLKRTGSS